MLTQLGNDEVEQPALPGVSGWKMMGPECRAYFANSPAGSCCYVAVALFFEAGRVEAEQIMFFGAKPKRLNANMLQRQEQLGTPRQQHRYVGPLEVHDKRRHGSR